MVKTRILIISDTHCTPLRQSPGQRKPFSLPLPDADVLIHCGDLTHQGTLAQFHKTLDMLSQIQAPVKLVIAGNHDLSLDRDFVFGHLEQNDLSEEQAASNVQQARDLWTASWGRAKQEGITFLDEGVHRIDLPNGARMNVYASPYTPEFCDMGFAYERDEDRVNPPAATLVDAKDIAQHAVPSFSGPSGPIDVMITHGPPYGWLDRTTSGDLVGCPHLLRALMRARPLLHCFGHIHECYGAESIRWSSDADKVATCDAHMEEWKDGAWEFGITDDGVDAVEQHGGSSWRDQAAFRNISGIQRGEETLLVNAAIMNVDYRPTHAPWLVELQLPRIV